MCMSSLPVHAKKNRAIKPCYAISKAVLISNYLTAWVIAKICLVCDVRRSVLQPHTFGGISL